MVTVICVAKTFALLILLASSIVLSLSRPFAGEMLQMISPFEPGPVVLITTVRKGRPNIMTPSWRTMIDFDPPLLACVVSDRNYTFHLLKAAKECIINIPTVELAKKSAHHEPRPPGVPYNKQAITFVPEALL